MPHHTRIGAPVLPLELYNRLQARDSITLIDVRPLPLLPPARSAAISDAAATGTAPGHASPSCADSDGVGGQPAINVQTVQGTFLIPLYPVDASVDTSKTTIRDFERRMGLSPPDHLRYRRIAYLTTVIILASQAQLDDPTFPRQRAVLIELLVKDKHFAAISSLAVSVDSFAARYPFLMAAYELACAVPHELVHGLPHRAPPTLFTSEQPATEVGTPLGTQPGDAHGSDNDTDNDEESGVSGSRSDHSVSFSAPQPFDPLTLVELDMAAHAGAANAGPAARPTAAADSLASSAVQMGRRSGNTDADGSRSIPDAGRNDTNASESIPLRPPLVLPPLPSLDAQAQPLPGQSDAKGAVAKAEGPPLSVTVSVLSEQYNAFPGVLSRVTYPSEILDGFLFLGSIFQAKVPYILEDMGITHVINVSTESYRVPPSVKQLQIPILDSPDADMTVHLEKIFSFIGAPPAGLTPMPSPHAVALRSVQPAAAVAAGPRDRSFTVDSVTHGRRGGEVRTADTAAAVSVSALAGDSKETVAGSAVVPSEPVPVAAQADDAAALPPSLPQQQQSGRRRVLVHCQYGISRSATVVIAYLMKHYSTRLVDTHALVQSHRPQVYPNVGFMAQLCQLELEWLKLPHSSLLASGTLPANYREVVRRHLDSRRGRRRGVQCLVS